MRLDFIPDQEGYSYTQASNAVETHDLRGGFASRRLDLLDTTLTFSVRFTLDGFDFDTFMEWLDAYDNDPQWFDCLLISDPITPEHHLRNHKAQIIPDSVSIGGLDGHRVVISMQLEAYMDELLPTSRLYQLAVEDGIDPFFQIGDGYNYRSSYEDEFESAGVSFVTGTIISPLVTYIHDVPEELESSAVEFTTGELRQILLAYNHAPAEELKSVSLIFQSGQLRVALITYSNWPVESLDSTTVQFLSGTLA